jgi:hypothetical protein
MGETSGTNLLLYRGTTRRRQPNARFKGHRLDGAMTGQFVKCYLL